MIQILFNINLLQQKDNFLLPYLDDMAMQICNNRFKNMNADTQFEKVVELQFHGITYIISLRGSEDRLRMELEDKWTGELWQGEWQTAFIEQITRKTGNFKKYQVFLKMLLTAFTRSSDTVFVDVLTHHDIEMQNTRRNPHGSRTTDPIILSRRYIILSYMVEFDKVHYPLALNQNQHPPSERLQLTIRRLSEELKDLQGHRTVDSSAKEISLLKHENQLLKSKLRSQPHQNQNKNSNNGLESQLSHYQQQIQHLAEENTTLKTSLQLKQAQQQGLKQSHQQLLHQLAQKQQYLKEWKHKFEQQEKSMHNTEGTYKQYEKKVNQISQEVYEMGAELQHARENDKKNKLKIVNLEKELEKLMQVKTMKTHQKYDVMNSSRKSMSAGGSVSGRKVSEKKNVGRKKISVYDSDTQSSRMRKMNNSRTSPYRQTLRPNNQSKSGQKSTQKPQKKYSNISNINNLRPRNRSRSKSVKRTQSPPAQITESSMMMTDGLGYASDSDSEQRIEKTMAQLRNRKTARAVQKQKKQKVLNPLEEKISSIAQMMRKIRNND